VREYMSYITEWWLQLRFQLQVHRAMRLALTRRLTSTTTIQSAMTSS